MDKNYVSLINSAEVVMVEFYATWCSHCQRMMPVVSQIRELLSDSAEIYQIDIDKFSELADEMRVTATPTFIIYRGGREVWRGAGEMDGNVLLQKIEQAMA